MNCDTRRQVRTVGTRTASGACTLLQEDGTQVFVRQTETPEKRATHNPQNDSGRRMQAKVSPPAVFSRSPTQRPHQMTPGDATVKMVRCRRLRACFCDRHTCALFWSVWSLADRGRTRPPWPGVVRLFQSPGG